MAVNIGRYRIALQRCSRWRWESMFVGYAGYGWGLWIGPMFLDVTRA